jgi:hypothetical protein
MLRHLEDSIRLLASQDSFTIDEAFPEFRVVQLGRWLWFIMEFSSLDKTHSGDG